VAGNKQGRVDRTAERWVEQIRETWEKTAWE
jgi:hypothetical protein